MRIIKWFYVLFLSACNLFAAAQTTYVEEGSKDILFLERLEIKQQANNDLNFSALRPFSRRTVVRAVELLDSASRALTDSSGRMNVISSIFTSVDEYNRQSFLMNNREWVSTPLADFESKRPLGPFYKTKTNLLEINSNNFFLAVNPVFNFSIGKENNQSERLFVTTYGLRARGRIADKIGFSGFITQNRERGPAFFRQRADSLHAVPGVGHYRKIDNTGYQYIDARGYLTAGITKFIDVQFGYDKNFIGNGNRSLFLSDWSSPYLFLKLNTRVWKFNYQNIFVKLRPQFLRAGDTSAQHKYAAIHHLSVNVTKWLTLGGFEAVVFSRKDHFDFQYLNPVIFYRAVEGNVGSPDNAFVGFDAKANIARRAQLYGQFLLDEFVLSRIKNDPTYWANKYGMQLGAKYIDAFGIKNLDLQLEANRVRPFTYSHGDTTANYTHYNQPVAHPLGANFRELIGIINYQPAPRWYLYAKAIYYYKGLDSAGINFGGNPFENYRNRTKEFGFEIGSGSKMTVLNAFFQASYEWKQNLYFDFSVQYRRSKWAQEKSISESLFYTGVRLNMFTRQRDY